MDLAAIIRNDPDLAKILRKGDAPDRHHDFLTLVDDFIERFGDLSCAVTGGKNCVLGTGPLYNLLLELADQPAPAENRPKQDRFERLHQNFVSKFEAEEKTRAEDMLELARNSYQLRDDDNIYLGRIEAQLLAAIQEARQRLAKGPMEALRQVLEEVDFKPETKKSISTAVISGDQLQARQLTGQPSGPGIAKGSARVIRSHADLAEFKSKEVLVCDSVDPNMTFVVPLASAVVERRGGMLIHGAIIAREYGLPCITGVPDAVTLIKTGDEITVDGYLGIVTLGETIPLDM
jgi:pyruvate,water dikinase